MEGITPILCHITPDKWQGQFSHALYIAIMDVLPAPPLPGPDLLCCSEEMQGPSSQAGKDKTFTLMTSELFFGPPQVIRSNRWGASPPTSHITPDEWQSQFSSALTLVAGLPVYAIPGSALMCCPGEGQGLLSTTELNMTLSPSSGWDLTMAPGGGTGYL